MRLIKKSEAESFTNGPTCTGYAFPFGDPDIDIAIVLVNGRYPEKDRVVNEVSKEIAYILSGVGEIIVGEEPPRHVEAGDSVMIQPGEKYYWLGKNLEMVMPCSPAFDPGQHKNTK